MGDIVPCANNKGAQELLVEFQETGRQEPFEEIARRYAGMVYSVAMQVTRDAHDAEDATQATFLTLAVHARTTGKIRFVGPWLRKVSHRLALDIRRSKKRRVAREERHSQANGNGNGNGNGHGDGAPAFSGMQMEELRQILREELDKLPAKYRLPLILYYFGGLSPIDMGKELNCNTSTLGVRLHRGRKMLADNLAHRGITMPMSVMIGLLTGLVDAFVKDNLVHSASHGAAQVAAHGGLSAQTAISGHVLSVMHTTTRALALSKPRTMIAVALLLISSLTGAAGVLRHVSVLDLGSTLKHLNFGNLLRPLLDHLRLSPMSVADVDISQSDLQVQPSLTPETQLSLLPDFDQSTSPGQFFSSSASVVSASHFAAANNLRLSAISTDWTTTTPQPTTAAPVVTAPLAVAAKPALTIAPPMQAPAATSSAPAAASSADSIIVDRTTSGPSSFGTINAAGDMFITGGSLHAHSLIVGDKTTGSVTQTGGDVKLDGQLVLGNQSHSSGSYSISGASTLSSPTIIVGNAGDGSIMQTGGSVAAVTSTHTGTLVLGSQLGSSGSYAMSGGTLDADHVVIGKSGTGSLTQTGGSATLTTVTLGQNSTGVGTLNLSGGTLSLGAPSLADATGPAPASPAPPLSPVLTVGGNGAGTVVLNPTGSVAIVENSSTIGATLLVRSSATGTGTIDGWGNVALTGPLVQNGQVIADGFGQPHALDLSSAAFVANTIANPTQGGTSGWYARNGGSVVLAPINITGEQAYNWGDDAYASSIDLVNSVRFTPHGLSGTGAISITLLDPKSTDVPQLPVAATSLWQLDSSVNFSSIDLTVRYDDAMAAAMQIPEDQLNLWVYEDGWQMLADSDVDLTDKLISATADGMPTYFATAPADATQVLSPSVVTVVPEPAALAILAISAGTILARRRRN